METPSKFMAMSSSNGNNNVASRYDRLIGLPDHIIHHIISFLGANDIARISFCSKRYQQICISSPYLYFDVDCASHECDPKCRQIKKYLSKFLRLRNGQYCLQWLRFRWLCDSCEPSHGRPYDSWICDALSCDVKELDIGCRVLDDQQSRFTFPMSAAGYASLRVLKLNFQDCRLNELSTCRLVSLEVLSMKSLRVSGDLLDAWISTNCTSLKSLNLEAVEIIGGFCISTTSSLEELTVNNCYVSYSMGFCKSRINGSSLKNVTISDCQFMKAGFCKVEIACSSLENLTIQGCPLYDSHVSIACPLLENLTIHRCNVMKYNGIDIKYCPSLINLMISQCTFQLLYLNILTSSSLRKFSVFECNSEFPIRIAVSAQQLQTLSVKLFGSQWEGSVFKIDSQNLKSLQDVAVEFVDLPSSCYTKSGICNSVLSTAQYARVLSISIQIIQLLSEEDRAQILFEKLIDLVIICDRLEICQMMAMACFLMKAPNLRTLTIRYEQNSSEISETIVKDDLVMLVSMAVKDYQSKHGNSETLLLGDQLMKLKLSLRENEPKVGWLV